MLKPLSPSRWSNLKSALFPLVTTLLLGWMSPSQANPDSIFKVPKMIANMPTMTVSPPSSLTVDVSNEPVQQEQDIITSDPLESPHPIPWGWVMNTYTELSESGKPGLRYYRSSSLISPDGEYAAYSRIKMKAEPELFRSRVTSVMFLENRRTGDLQTITASSPLADNPFEDNQEANQPGAISILIPVSWSAEGDRLLARQFEGFFSTSDMSDYAVIWQRQGNRTKTVTPNQIEYTNAVLLGWSDSNPNQVLFRAGDLGEENWPVWAVDLDGDTELATTAQPILYGRLVQQVWTGPQAKW